MIRYTGTKQLKPEFFRTPSDTDPDQKNKRVMLSGIIPWDEPAGIYRKRMHKRHGRPSLSPRVAVGALIIKHIKGLSDELVTEEISENPYLQYFPGYEEFRTKRAFDPSLFVYIRKRTGFAEFTKFTKFNELLIHRINEFREKHSSAGEKGKDDKPDKPAKGENEKDDKQDKPAKEENEPEEE
ncbi:MAG: transposase, partial [Ignavibacteria bacterium]